MESSNSSSPVRCVAVGAALPTPNENDIVIWELFIEPDQAPDL